MTCTEADTAFQLASDALSELLELKAALDAEDATKAAALNPESALPASLRGALPTAPPPRTWETTPAAPPPPHLQAAPAPPASRAVPLSPAAAAAAAVAAAAASLAGATLGPPPAAAAGSLSLVIPVAREATRARHALMPAASQPLPASQQFEVLPLPPPPPPPPGPPPTELPAGGLVDVLAPGARPAPPPPRTAVVPPTPDDARADHARLTERLALYGLREKSISGDGNCQFRALADQLWRDQGRHAEVRSRVVQQLRANPDAYAVFVTEPYGDYCARMGCVRLPRQPALRRCVVSLTCRFVVVLTRRTQADGHLGRSPDAAGRGGCVPRQAVPADVVPRLVRRRGGAARRSGRGAPGRRRAVALLLRRSALQLPLLALKAPNTHTSAALAAWKCKLRCSLPRAMQRGSMARFPIAPPLGSEQCARQKRKKTTLLLRALQPHLSRRSRSRPAGAMLAAAQLRLPHRGAAPCARRSAPRRSARTAPPPRAGGPPVIDPDERSVSLAEGFAAWQSGVAMVDVRSAREFRAEAVARAKNAPLYLVPTTLPIGAVDWAMDERRGRDKMPPYNESFETQLRAALGGGDGAQSTMALLVCSNGQRSREACRLLAEEGYDNLRWVHGGMAAWLDAYTPRGLPRKRVVQGVFRDTGALMCVRCRAALPCGTPLTRPAIAQLDGQRGGGHGAARARGQYDRLARLKELVGGLCWLLNYLGFERGFVCLHGAKQLREVAFPEAAASPSLRVRPGIRAHRLRAGAAVLALPVAAGAAQAAADALDDLDEDGGAVAQGLGEDLQQHTLVIAVHQHPQRLALRKLFCRQRA